MRERSPQRAARPSSSPANAPAVRDTSPRPSKRDGGSQWNQRPLSGVAIEVPPTTVRLIPALTVAALLAAGWWALPGPGSSAPVGKIVAPDAPDVASSGKAGVASGSAAPIGAPEARPWPLKVVAAVPFVGTPVLLPGGTQAVGLVPAGSELSSPEQLESVDLATGAVRKGPEVVGGSVVLKDRGALYVVAPRALGKRGRIEGPYAIHRLAPASLALGPAVAAGDLCQYCLSLSPMSVQPTGHFAGDLWLTGTGAPRLVDPSTGAVAATIKLPHFRLTDLAVEPDGRFLDVSVTPRSGFNGSQVLELTDPGGKLVKTLGFLAAETPLLTTVPSGLWASWRGGMTGETAHFSEGELKGTTSCTSTNMGAGPPVPGMCITMGEWAARAGDVLMLTDAVGASCLHLAGTRVLASTMFPPGSHGTTVDWSPFGAVGRDLYTTTPAVLGTPEHVVVVKCRSLAGATELLPYDWPWWAPGAGPALQDQRPITLLALRRPVSVARQGGDTSSPGSADPGSGSSPSSPSSKNRRGVNGGAGWP